MSHYWDEQLMIADGKTPTILAVGDSWFFYPFYGGSLINNIGDIINQRVVYAKGQNGAEAYDYVKGKYKGIVKQMLNKYGSVAEAVLISGGGNDFAGFNDLRPLLKNDCSAETTANGCFKTGNEGLGQFMKNLEDNYRLLIGLIYTYTNSNCHIVMHSYDYAIPDGKGVFGDHAWLKPALTDAKVSQSLMQDCVALILDKFYQMLTRLVAMDKDHLHIVDSRGTLDTGDWANELHPNASGFKKIAMQKWQPLLVELGLA